MSIFDDPAERLAKWTERRMAGGHDERCEQRERSYICHCRKRARIARGLVTPPDEDLHFPPPSCPTCYGDLDTDGDAWTCGACSLSWDMDGSASSAEFTDDYGSDFGGEQWGDLMRDLARQAAS